MAVILEKKGSKVSLAKKEESNLGEILINLNWNQKIVEPKGFFQKLFGAEPTSQSIDLDLGCLYELKNGRKGCIQALGKSFGHSLDIEPYIVLDGDDRTGENNQGENIRVNGNKISEIKRILLFTYIYGGAVNWADANGVVTIKSKFNEDIVIHMDEHKNNHAMCALAMITNENDNSFAIEKLVEYFPGHKAMDRAYKWNIQWKPGKK